MTDMELQRLERDAIRTASRKGAPVAIYNLNSAGRRMLVIRDVIPGADPYSGPFQPVPKWQAEFPDFPAEAIPALGDGWADSSWHCDACPSFIHEESGVCLWVDWPDVAMRESESPGAAYLFQQMERHPSLGWQHGIDGSPELLATDCLGDVRDVLDHLATIPGATMAEALQGARMRLNQLTPADAREFIRLEMEHVAKGGKGCPDLLGSMQAILAKEGDSHGKR